MNFSEFSSLTRGPDYCTEQTNLNSAANNKIAQDHYHFLEKQGYR